ncbi:exo-alpha-sialidase [Lacihabitans sp. LS3-19]|uniref:sialidase family protein n=1 Tax=Lacihabitans sp. LS3-19 TaxID=2487335 RepID=UPI0020CD267C|nr:sialidase family protein [Lacihabitans sp. LS3-19]MCP9766447.1 exo-alpha-sialidase [Lacihabitans sp. LS3-19]
MKIVFIFLLLFISGCKLLPDSVSASKNEETKLSQFEKAGYCDLLIAKDGTYHTVFLEQPDYGKPVFVYYSSSTNKGKSWSAPVTVSNDGTGNGASIPKLIQDGSGTIYAIWKRYGSSDKNKYPVNETLLEGTGGYTIGTLFYAVLNGSSFGKPIMLASNEQMQISWFPTLDNAGKVHVVWSQLSDESWKNGWSHWYYADLITEATLNGGSFGNFKDYSTPGKPQYAGGAPPNLGFQNLSGYYDKQNKLHFIGEFVAESGVKTLFLFNGTKAEIAYQYPLYKEGNTFNNPAELLFDEKGNDHIIFRPPASTLESDQIWDFDVATRKTNILASIQKSGVRIQNFQADQGPNGEIAVMIQASSLSESNEAYGFFYQNGKWQTKGLSQNASKDTFASSGNFYYDGYITAITSSERSLTNFIDVAWDASGKKSMVMNVSIYFVGQGFSTNSPSIYFSKID